MTMNSILVLNAGSSSLKVCVFGADPDLPLLGQGRITGIGGHPEFSWNGVLIRQLSQDLDQAGALHQILQWIHKSAGNWRLRAVGHRIVHGGERFTAPELLTQEVRQQLEALIPLAPLHQPHSLSAIRTVAELNPELPQIGCFDTAFHSHHDPLFQHYALPKYWRDRGVRRYGFHGLSYEWIARVLESLHPEVATGRIVAAHLGNGASLCAMRAGKSVDTTMGMTALDGLPMGTRCGSIDPGVVLYMLRAFELDADRVEQILSYDSGLAGLSGISHDMRFLLASDKPEAAFAIRFFAMMAAQHVARMAASLGGIDALVFTGGIGEHAAPVRRLILDHLRFLEPFTALVIAANEERMIAEHCWSVLKQEITP